MTDRWGCGYSAFKAAPAGADPARRVTAQNREEKMTDTSLWMPLLHSSHAANAWTTGKAISNYLTG